MNRCTATTGRWPDALVDVSPDEEEEFLAHAEGCPYHAAALQAEDEQFVGGLRKDYRLARVLGRGRILEGEELVSAVESRRAGSNRWREAAAKLELPFSYIALYCNGAEIARYSKLYKLKMHDGVHELEPDSWIEVWAVIVSEGRKVEDRLGSYHLTDAGMELSVPLGNGDKASLKVSGLDDGTFGVEFRFIETEKSEENRQGEGRPHARAAAAGGGAAGQRPPAKRASIERPTGPRDVRPTQPADGRPAEKYKYVFLLLLTFGLVTSADVLRRGHLLPAEQPQGSLAEVRHEGKQTGGVEKPGDKGPRPAADAPAAKGEEEVAGGPQTPGRPTKPRALQNEAADKTPRNSTPSKSDVAGADVNLLQRVMKANSQKPSPTPDASVELPATYASGASTREPRASGLALRASLDNHGSARPAFVIFRVVGHERTHEHLHEKVLEQLRAGLKASGRDVQPVTAQPAELAARELMNVELLVEKTGGGLELTFLTKVDGRREELGASHGSGETVAEASMNALKATIPKVFDRIDEVLKVKEQLAPDAGGGNPGGGGADVTDGRLYLSRVIDRKSRPCTEEVKTVEGD